LKKEKIGIVGAGAVGRMLAVVLASRGYEVELVNRKPKGIKINNKYEYSLKGDFGKLKALIHSVKTIESLSKDLSVIIFTTRAYDTVNIIEKHLPKLKFNGVVVTIQNVFCIDKISRLIPSNKSVCAYLDICCIKEKDMVIAKDFNGTTLGIYDCQAFENMQYIKSIFQSFTTVHETKDIMGFVLGRNIINGAISMLGAISGMNLGDILWDRNGRFLFKKIIMEAVSVIKRFRINILPYNGNLDYYKFTEKSLGGMSYRRKIISILRKNNRYVRSSALSDIENGRRTEIGFVLGLIMEYGKKYKLDIKYITEIYNMVLEIEKGERPVSENAFYDERLLKLQRYKGELLWL